MKPLALALLLAGPALAWSQTAPSPSPQVLTPPATRPATPAAPPASMVFEFRDAPVDAILDALAENFGLTIIKGPPIPGRITIISRGKNAADAPLTAEQAIEVTNSLLLPLGYGIVETTLSPESGAVYRVSTIPEIKKAAPVGIAPAR